MDIAESRELGVSTFVGSIRLEESHQDIVQVETSAKTSEMPKKEARLVFEEGTTSGALSLPYGSDEDEEEYIYVPLELLEGRDIQVPNIPISDIIIQKIKGGIL